MNRLDLIILPLPKGRKLSKEHVEKLRIAHLGNKYTLGRRHTQEEIEKIRQSRLGKKASVESRRRMSLGQIASWKRRKLVRKTSKSKT